MPAPAGHTGSSRVPDLVFRPARTVATTSSKRSLHSDTATFAMPLGWCPHPAVDPGDRGCTPREVFLRPCACWSAPEYRGILFRVTCTRSMLDAMFPWSAWCSPRNRRAGRSCPRKRSPRPVAAMLPVPPRRSTAPRDTGQVHSRGSQSRPCRLTCRDRPTTLQFALERTGTARPAPRRPRDACAFGSIPTALRHLTSGEIASKQRNSPNQAGRP